MAQPGKSPKAADKKYPDGLHYDKQALLTDYQDTYSIFMKMLMIGVGGAIVYFFALIVYLGARGHTPSTDYAKEFNERYPQEYSGLKLPMFGGPATPEQAEPVVDAAKPTDAITAAPSAPAVGIAPAAH